MRAALCGLRYRFPNRIGELMGFLDKKSKKALGERRELGVVRSVSLMALF